ncbi:MAG TPA: ABC transporter permease [bacterium]|nr:ABC transporter permease [bacterium]
MVTYVVRRFAEMAPTLFGVSIVVFMIVRMVPGDPARLIAGVEASEADVTNIRRQLGLTDSLPQQYARFLSGVVTGDFGRSLKNHQPVLAIIAQQLPYTVQLAAASLVVTLSMGLTAGVLAAVKRGTVLDSGSMVLALLGVSMPSFWLGLMMIFLFAVTLRWLPTSGAGSLRHLIMPAITLGIGSVGIVARMTRASLLEVLGQDFVRTAVAKGLHRRAVVMKHALRNAMIPTATVVGVQIGTLLAGSVVTETVFAWPGAGRLLVDSVAFRDYPLIQATILLFALVFMLANLLVDVSYAVLDPRIRYD